MSINGVLEDLALSDVLQFVHLSRRTGTLYLWRSDDRRAEIGFHDGHIVSAWSPGHRRLGDLLIAAEIINQATLDSALGVQKQEGGDRTLGQILLAEDAVTREDIHQVIKEQVHGTIFDLLTWRYGSFHFEVDELRPIDDIGLVPGELLDDLDLNTQMVLLEAARHFDEQPAQVEALEPEDSETSLLDRRLKVAGFRRGTPEGEERDGERLADGVLDGAGESPQMPPAKTAPEPVRFQVVSQDRRLLTTLQQELASDLARIVVVRGREAGNRVPGENASPIVLFDLRDGDAAIDDIASLARTRPAAPVIALVGSEEQSVEAYTAGAVAVFAEGAAALTACCANLARTAQQAQPQVALGFTGQGGFRHFRRVVYDVRSGLLSATMALNLMHVISESVERAVLFLVQGDDLTAVGAFGFSRTGEGLAELASGLKLTPSSRSALSRSLANGEPQSLDFDDAHLGEELELLLGRPASGQVVIFPVRGAERMISVIYTDNGQRDEEIQDIRILELATSQVGVAFEDELLRQKLGKDGFAGVVG
ncbi:MAG: DUF4388 domain-containing protein [Acidobacteriota bacterium]